MHTGWTSPMMPVLHSPDSPVHITDSDESWLEAIIMIGAFCGLPTTIYLVDKVGRKKSIILSAVASIVTWLLIAVANRVEYLYVARFLAGMSGNMAFVAAPMYIAEIASEKIRGLLAGIIYIMMLVGNLVIYCIGPFVKIYVSSLVPIGLLILMLITFSYMPESPYYLLIENKRALASKSLQMFRGTEDVEEELQEISTAVARQKAEEGRFRDLLCVPSNRRALLTMLLLNFGMNASCIYVIYMNLHTIMASAKSIYINAEHSAIIFACLLILSAMLALSVVDKFGRKILLTCSSILTGIALGVLGCYFAAKNSGVDVSTLSWLPVATVMVYALFFKCGIGLIPIIMTAELFPTSVKAMGMTLSDACLVVAATFMLTVFRLLEKSCGIHVPFFVFAVTCILLGVVYYIVVPETKGKTLEQIQYLLKGLNQEEIDKLKNGVALEAIKQNEERDVEEEMPQK